MSPKIAIDLLEECDLATQFHLHVSGCDSVKRVATLTF